MNAPRRARLRRLARFAAALGLLAALLFALALWLLQPPRATGLLLGGIGKSLGLRITAAGPAEYRLRGTPQLVLRNVVAQRPGDDAALFRAERVLLSLPWSTIRAGGDDLVAQRLELDAPVLDVPALQRWLATRPQGETRIPALRDGLRIVRGRIDNDDWTIDGIGVESPTLAPGQRLAAHLKGRYLDPPSEVAFDLDVAMTRPANDAGVAVLGGLVIVGDGWRLPGRLHLAGPLHLGDDEVRMHPAKIGFAARHESRNTATPFVLGAHGPLLFDEGVWSLQPARLVLRGNDAEPARDAIPQAKAHGAVALGRRLVLRLEGEIAQWPQGWPALPPPLSASTSAMPFALDYVGKLDMSEAAVLRLRRDDTRFEARFRLPRVLGWLEGKAGDAPLPPLQGALRTPRIDVAGAALHGVEIEFDDE